MPDRRSAGCAPPGGLHLRTPTAAGMHGAVRMYQVSSPSVVPGQRTGPAGVAAEGWGASVWKVVFWVQELPTSILPGPGHAAAEGVFDRVRF